MTKPEFSTANILSASFIVFSLLSIIGCKTIEEPAPQGVIETPEPEPDPILEPSPLNINWAGTAWILPDSPEQKPKDFPGYRGFFLGRDGRLLLINQDNA
ncbi:MAG: hypothetical protein KAH21_06065, partial [Spirochaetaceae bacterium]|nr:hypothetical protein [Spirochaetaceae bacterium]